MSTYLRREWPVLLLSVLLSSFAAAQQSADTSYLPPPFEPAYTAGNGPVVHVDAAHHNFHTAEERYAPFARILKQDGYDVRSSNSVFTEEYLNSLEVLVISNALPEQSLGNWRAPTHSAFEISEIEAVRNWVRAGGRLFLIADHMPMAGGARLLAEAFGYTFYDCFADDTTTQYGAERFTLADRSLTITALESAATHWLPVDSVTSFTGQAFQIPEEAESILNCGEGWIIRIPEVAWQFNEDTPVIDANGWSQGAIQEYGAGRLVVWGEAAMFTGQVVTMEESTFKVGMNSERGKYNYRLLLNLMRWLTQ